MNASLHACMHACMHVCMNACMNVNLELHRPAAVESFHCKKQDASKHGTPSMQGSRRRWKHGTQSNKNKLPSPGRCTRPGPDRAAPCEEGDAGETQELRAGREHEHLPRHRVGTTAGGRSKRRGRRLRARGVPKPGRAQERGDATRGENRGDRKRRKRGEE